MVINTTDKNTYYHIKMAAFQELQEALQIKNVNDELLEFLISSLRWLLHYETKHNIQLPEKEKISEIVSKGMEIAAKLPSNIPISDGKLHDPDYTIPDEDDTEPYKWFCQVNVGLNQKILL